MFDTVLNLESGGLLVPQALLCCAASLVLGILISAVYMFKNNGSKSMAVSLALMPVLVQIVIMMVNGNLGTGIAVLGAFSLIRFRSVPGSAREICSIFFSMVIGIACGMGYLTFALAAALIIGAAQIILFITPFGEVVSGEKELRVTIPESLDYTEIFDDIFVRYLKKHSLEQVKTTNLGSMFDLRYLVEMKRGVSEKEMIDEIRCRNGNLTVSLGRSRTLREEL